MRARAIVLAGLVALGGCTGASGVRGRAPITEDSPGWDCATMGNRQCGSTIYIPGPGGLVGWDVNDPGRPGCFVEPSSVAAGFEVVRYSHIGGRGAPEYLGDPLGFEVPCGGVR